MRIAPTSKAKILRTFPECPKDCKVPKGLFWQKRYAACGDVSVAGAL
jgi:hypothetical protein